MNGHPSSILFSLYNSFDSVAFVGIINDQASRNKLVSDLV